MQYRKLGTTGLEVSALGFGCMRLPTLGSPEMIDEKKAENLIWMAVERGVNYLDTAWFYHSSGQGKAGESEPFLGQLLGKGLRDRVILATKLPQQLVRESGQMEDYLSAQLSRLRTDRVDLYLVHALNGEAWNRMRDLGVREFLDRAKASGRIGHIGFSFHGSREDFSRILDEYEGWEFCQIQYNYIDIDFQAGLAGLRLASSRGLGVVVMEPLRGGRLAGGLPPAMKSIFEARPEGWSPAEWALRYVWNDPGVSLLLSGMGEAGQVEENLRVASEAGAGNLGGDMEGVYEAARSAMRGLYRADCTACRYCQPCPAGVQIPECLAALNASAVWGTRDPWTTGFSSIEGGPGLCTECGICEGLCPQDLPIRALLKETASVFARS